MRKVKKNLRLQRGYKSMFNFADWLNNGKLNFMGRHREDPLSADKLPTSVSATSVNWSVSETKLQVSACDFVWSLHEVCPLQRSPHSKSSGLKLVPHPELLPFKTAYDGAVKPMLQAFTPSTLETASNSSSNHTVRPSQSKGTKERYHKQRLAEVKRYIQQLRTEYRFQLITAAGAILQGLKVLGKVNWKQKVTDLIKILKIPARTFRYGLNRLLISNLIGSEGRGEHRRIWWKTPPNDWQHTADDWQHIANDGQHIANDGQHIANENSESIDITAFDESSILFPDSFQTSFNEDEKEDFEIELKIEPEEPVVTRLVEAEVGEAEVVNEVEIEEEESQGNSQTHEDKFSAPPAPPQKSFVSPREIWLRRKAQTLPEKPRNLDMWVRSQLQEKNWEKWSDDYQADQMPKSQPEPAGLREKVAKLQAQGVQVGVANIRGEVIVNLPDRGMTAGEFMTTPNEDLVPKSDPEARAKGLAAIREMVAKIQANMAQR